MQGYDVAMLAVLALATLWGAWKGMAWQIASLTSLVASYFVALRFSASLAPYFSRQEPWNRFLAMLLLYLLTSLVIWMAFRAVKRFIDRVQLKEFDRQLGGLFGAAKGVLLCVAITFFAVSLSAQAREAVLKSRSGYYIALLFHRADGIMPKELHQVLDPYIEQLERQLDPRGSAEGERGPPRSSSGFQPAEWGVGCVADARRAVGRPAPSGCSVVGQFNPQALFYPAECCSSTPAAGPPFLPRSTCAPPQRPASS